MSTTSKHFLTAILQQLGSIEVGQSSHTPSTAGHASTLADLKGRAAEQARSAMLTLHFLFPHELLPALDLVDRKLVNRLRCQHGDGQASSLEVFYVQSASAVTESVNRRSASSRFRNAWTATKIHYEVRLDSWNCTCAAYAQSQLKLLLADHGGGAEERVSVGIPEADLIQSRPLVGGVATKSNCQIPICKHILAAALANAAPNLFADGLQSREVSKEETAAWSAGWGET
ncbi:hypothetical protein PMZ80_010767 [Knufia obscura]|uniref:SWIM-type domain-containing protein n=2 Tax=Knufia TaxID=430999 RepID=A0AAN8I333_9EURO|nr:hypothetical protein PMZ80_010767 [Knufia obscura]KAK5949804.1 hypothetical protein OHC33_009193 [Knufia fluminis]